MSIPQQFLMAFGLTMQSVAVSALFTKRSEVEVNLTIIARAVYFLLGIF
jgi:hypothetical protein